ncbi:M23 family metallopeptidase [Raineyella sp. W15-4]|uniref:M23 family metallopeptidase n=1 Tax=Raineyella sp. W15-4 TaxID=3081651 RepID=UPI00295550CA|nr:M23 family metallopeptidase [Raineyella sp. W15-4]WOQ15759.1 M23 family metallopeptidase [Raineyella sp. W15-4]
MNSVTLRLPFTGRWRALNSPARRVPSHGSELFGESHAIDFVAVDEADRTARTRDWRTILATEPPERFVGFGRPILAPIAGRVVVVHDGEPDHAARRSQLALLPYALGQARRVGQGIDAIAGNHIILHEPDSGTYVALVHLRAGSLTVRPGDEVVAGAPLGQCGNSGNSTQPHLHLQVMDALDLRLARGVPLLFADFREWPAWGGRVVEHDSGIPAEGSVVTPA